MEWEVIVTIGRLPHLPATSRVDYLVTERNQRLAAQWFDLSARKLVGEPLEKR